MNTNSDRCDAKFNQVYLNINYLKDNMRASILNWFYKKGTRVVVFFFTFGFLF